MSWKIKQVKNLTLKNPIFIEGLPGIGNVGKVAVDFLIDEVGATKIYEISSPHFPNSVFINEKNLVELPKIEIFAKKTKNQDFLFMSGDVQPGEEVSSYEFAEEILSMCKKHNCKDIIALGGIGLGEVPKKPKLYCTGNTKKAVNKYGKDLNNELYGIVGPIVGISGLLLGLAKKETDAVAILAETYGHPMYIGVKGAKEIVKYLNKKFTFKIDIKKLDREIKEMEEEVLKKAEEIVKVSQGKTKQEVNYIG